MAVLKVALIALMLAAAVAATTTEVDVEVDEEGKPRKGRKLVSPRVLAGKAMMKKSNIVIVPKGDPRARAPVDAQTPAGVTPASGSQMPVLKSGTYTTSAACQAKAGQCIDTSVCSTRKGTLFRGVCPGASVCCIGGTTTSTQPTTPVTPPTVDAGQCPGYAGLATTNKAGNGNVIYATVPIKAEHMTEPGKVGMSDELADNTMRLQPTACAFARMQALAAAAGVNLKIASGFRTLKRQQYFYNCMLTKKCNGGNKAAVPGNSNHGVGLALDLNADCGKQAGAKAPTLCKSSKVYVWLLNNYRTHGFIRAVPSEPWHWEYRPGQAMPSYANF